MAIVVAERSFDQKAQTDFADLSGDRNPIHLNPVFAKRTQFGGVVVHGVHLLLWALDAAAAAGQIGVELVLLKATFLKPLYLHERASTSVAILDNGVSVRVSVDDITIMEVDLLRDAPSPMNVEAGIGAVLALRDAPVDRADENLKGIEGLVELASIAGSLLAFPAISAAIGQSRVAALLAITRIVGMECPGLHSLLSRITASLEQPAQDSTLWFSAVRFDARFRSVRIAVSGGGLQGSVEAFSRMRPINQPDVWTIALRVDPTSCAGHHALIIGGSRGLGEVAAKAVAAGGGNVAITYSSDRIEAERVEDQIRSWGGQCEVIKYDVRMPPAEQLGSLRHAPTHTYYFATPQIFRRSSGFFSSSAYHEFSLFYVDGFASLCHWLPADAAVFYPSTTAVTETVKGLIEYATAKSAGEKFCADLSVLKPGLRVLVKKLPRILTDQTATVALVEALSAEEVIIPIVTEMHALSAVVKNKNEG